MIRGLYGAASALEGASLNQEVMAQNIANATVPGYRAAAVQFTSFEQALNAAQGTETPQFAGAQPGAIYADFTAGPLRRTNNPLDVAVVGNAFFSVQGPEGTLLTRNGAFRLGPDNQLQTVSGRAVLGDGGPITIPPQSGKITIAPDGRVLTNNGEVGRIQLARVTNPQQLERVGALYFKPNGATQAPTLQEAKVVQGYLEESNVNVVQSLVSMMVGMRQYEASNRVLRTISESLQQSTRPGQ